MNKKLVWDLDGVIRSLYPAVIRRFNLWAPSEYEEWDNAGYNIYDLAKKDDYKFLIEAKPTKYFKTIKEYYNKKIIEIWSYQPEDWTIYTKEWLNKHFKAFVVYWLKPEEKYKRLKTEKNTLLVDDYPFHKSYDNILLINQKYNSKVEAKNRITSVKDLRGFLNG